MFKNSAIVEANSLLFNSAFKPNSKKTVLAMTTFNEDTNSLESYFSPTITIPFKGTFLLTKTLEFIVRDANKKQFALQDSCQLYLLLTIF